MTPEELEKLVKNRVEKCTALLFNAKKEQYMRGNDRLHNFKKIASMRNRTKEEAALDLMAKHWIALMDTVNDSTWMVSQGMRPIGMHDKLEEYFNDLHNYLFLLEGCFVENG